MSDTLYEYYDEGDNAFFGLYGNTWAYQSFTIGYLGTPAHHLTSVKLLLYNQSAVGTLTCDIRTTDEDGKPTGTILATETVDYSGFTSDTGGLWEEIVFSSPPFLDAGVKYCVGLHLSAGSSSSRICWRYDNSDPTYEGGAVIHSTDGGSSWTVYTVYDCMFREYGIEIVPTESLIISRDFHVGGI